MLKVFLLLALLVAVESGKNGGGIRNARYKNIRDRNTLRRLMSSQVSGESYATCEIVFFNTPMNYADASSACRNIEIGRPSSLVTVDSITKNSHVMFAFDYAFDNDAAAASSDENQYIWAGLKKVRNNDVVYDKKYMKKKKNVDKEYNAEDWVWASNRQSPVDFDKWPKKKTNARPNQEYMAYNANKGCLEEEGCFQNQLKISSGSDNGFWEDAWAFEEHPFACDYRGKYLVSGELQTWSKAKAICHNGGMVLASVRSMEEVRELRDAIDYFLGPQTEEYKKFDGRNWVWLGATDEEEEGVWRYLDGEVMEDWGIPWMAKAGNDNAMIGRKSTGQHHLAMNRDGMMDDSNDVRAIKKMFACECASARVVDES